MALILLSAASLVSTALVRREQAKTLAEQQKAEAAYRRERQRAEEAEARFRLARRAVDELIRVSEEELAHRPGHGGAPQAAARVGAGLLPGVHRAAPERPGAQAELRDTTRRVETILADLAVLRAAGELYLLAQPSALDDLRLDEGQRAKVAELSARAGRRWMESFGDPGRLPPAAERVRLALEQARANEAEVDAILTPPQRVRLRQLALQSEGPAAFREPEVVEALGLTPDQRERIRAIEEEVLFGQMREMQIGQGPPRTAAGKPGDGAHRGRPHRGAGATLERAGRRADPGPLSAFPMPFRTAARPEADAPLTAGATGCQDAGPHEKTRTARATRAAGSHLYPIGGAGRSARLVTARSTHDRLTPRSMSSPREVTPCIDEPSP